MPLVQARCGFVGGGRAGTSGSLPVLALRSGPASFSSSLAEPRPVPAGAVLADTSDPYAVVDAAAGRRDVLLLGRQQAPGLGLGLGLRLDGVLFYRKPTARCTHHFDLFPNAVGLGYTMHGAVASESIDAALGDSLSCEVQCWMT